MRRALLTLVALPLLATAPLAGAAAPKAVTVFTDPAGDAGLNPSNSPTAIAPVNNLGVDLVKGSVVRKGDNLEFTVTLGTSLQNFAALPEAARLVWQFTVDKGVEYRLNVKSFDIGKPDPVQQDGTDRIGKVYDKGVFRIEKCGDPVNSATPITFTGCFVQAYLTGKVDAAAKTLTWVLPLKTIKAKTGSKLVHGAGQLNDTGCDICFVAHYSERSLTPHTVIDNAPASFKWVVPKA